MKGAVRFLAGVAMASGMTGMLCEITAMATDDIGVPGPLESQVFGWTGLGLLMLSIVAIVIAWGFDGE